MAISVFDIFKIGIGPSSSHTVGPMRAAMTFVNNLEQQGIIDKVQRLRIELFGSLGATGKGHGTDKAVLLGLEGEAPDLIDPAIIPQRLAAIRETGAVRLLQRYPVPFNEKADLLFQRKVLPYHSNGMRFTVFDANGAESQQSDYYSVGGGFVVTDAAAAVDRLSNDDTCLPYPFKTGAAILKLCATHNKSISDLMLSNEKAWLSEEQIRRNLLNIWQVMQACVERGLHQEGVMPGGMKVRRRAANLYRQLSGEIPRQTPSMPVGTMEWVNLFALAVSEENASGGRVVTAPTNGAAGIIPAVLHYYWRFCDGANEEGVIRFLLTAAAIAILYKENASLSGAEVGCQGEVGVACSMAAGALAEVLGGTPEQVENAAEIGMEHNLGLTCDPVGGLVQVPCIERNAMGSVKAINAARIALRGDGKHFVSLDKVIKTMRETGADMKTKYKETSRGGLAVNLIEC
ncbi:MULTISPECIES: L-serine ammonia-lyase [Methylomonas]|uniref:L-serine dehydratase n=2 Tax=Methylomonas TaxID=416 RepID=A0A140E4F0_9GAMM|nr:MULTISPECIES: L-serine ammonia-lyase [Methylomonas]AMK75274.1 serine dehydratase [Methylomonas denitrificans]OAH99334.1 L-serine ammonia-lyase [Methylomonas methanica]TCV84979.1 L-serine ammonia-lyase [Methylomonas methanica]